MRLDHSARVGEDRVFAFDEPIGRQPAGAFPYAHAAAHGVKTHTDLTGCRDRVVDAAAIRKNVHVIARRRAAREHQFGHRGEPRHVGHLRSESRPERIKRLQPRKQVSILRCGYRSREALPQVVMRVDQARQKHMSGEIYHLVCGVRQLARRVDLLDVVAANENAAVGDLAACVVHRHHDTGMPDQECLFHQSTATWERCLRRLRRRRSASASCRGKQAQT